MNNPDTLLQQDLLARGWTKTLIAKHLGAPDEVRPRYGGGQLNIFYERRVVQKESLALMRAALDDVLAKRAGRQQAARRAVQTKVHRATDGMATAISERLDAELAIWTWPRLLSAACASYNRGDGIPEWAYGKRDWADNHRGGASEQSDPEFLHRICCNFVRHQLITYDCLLGSYIGKTQARDAAHDLIESAVYDLQSLTQEQEAKRDKIWKKEKLEQQRRARKEEQRSAEAQKRLAERTARVARLTPKDPAGRWPLTSAAVNLTGTA